MSTTVARAIGFLIIVALPLLALLVVRWRLGWKRRLAAEVLKRIRERIAGAEWSSDNSFRRGGRLYDIVVDTNPLFAPHCAIRLSIACPTLMNAEFQVPPRPKGLDTPYPKEAAEFMAAAQPLLAGIYPERWQALARIPGEVVLSGNRETFEDLERELDLLAKLAEIPSEPALKGGYWTIRSGFEAKPHAWHWKPEQRAALPPGAKRWCVSAWTGKVGLDLPLADFLWRLAKPEAVHVVTAMADLSIVERAFDRKIAFERPLAQVGDPRMAVIADHWYDGDFVDGIVAGKPGAAFDGAIRFQRFDRAIAALPSWRYYARPLFDFEFAWHTGEYEILSTTLTDEEVRKAFGAAAAERGAEVLEIDVPFNGKMLREDRLEGTMEKYEPKREYYR